MHKRGLAKTFLRGYALGMENAITPEQVREAAYNARVTLTEFLDRAGVSRSTFYSWERTGEPPRRKLTLAKLADAVTSA